MATESYDAIVVGGGHNGLVAAAYLAKSGAKTLVLEARGQTGGAATTEAPWPDAPDFKVTRLSYVMSLLPPTIMNDLQLEKHGYKIFPMGPYYQAFPEGGSLTLYEEDSQRCYDEIARWSKKDADAYPRWNAWLGGLADVLGPLLLTVPPNDRLAQPEGPQPDPEARLAPPRPRLEDHRRRDPADDDVDRRPAGRLVRIAADQGRPRGQRGDRHLAGPYEPGTAYVMAHHSIGDVGDGRLGSWGFPEGGMGAVAAAIASAARENGATIRTGAQVAKIIIDPGDRHGERRRPRHRRRDNSKSRSSPPCTRRRRSSTTSAEKHLPGDFVTDIEHWKTRSGVVKINLALAELPDFTANPGTHLQEHHTGSVEMAPSMEYIERAFIDAREGRPAQRPFSDGVIPTAFDKTLCPEGYHIMSLFTQWVPADWSREPHREELENVRRPGDRHLQRGRAQLQERHPAQGRRRPLRDGARLRADRRQHLPRRAVPRAALPHAPGARLRRLPDADPWPVLRQLGHPRGRRRVRHPGHAGREGRHRGPQGPAPSEPSARDAAVDHAVDHG